MHWSGECGSGGSDCGVWDSHVGEGCGQSGSEFAQLQSPSNCWSQEGVGVGAHFPWAGRGGGAC
eukprot:8757146-Alexandrium_andersonii.AAC.1